MNRSERLRRQATLLGDVLNAADKLNAIRIDLPGLDRDLSRATLGAVLRLLPDPVSGFAQMLGSHLMAQSAYEMARKASAGGAPRPKAEGAGGARSEDTSTEFPAAKKT